MFIVQRRVARWDERLLRELNELATHALSAHADLKVRFAVIGCRPSANR